MLKEEGEAQAQARAQHSDRTQSRPHRKPRAPQPQGSALLAHVSLPERSCSAAAWVGSSRCPGISTLGPTHFPKGGWLSRAAGRTLSSGPFCSALPLSGKLCSEATRRLGGDLTGPRRHLGGYSASLPARFSIHKSPPGLPPSGTNSFSAGAPGGPGRHGAREIAASSHVAPSFPPGAFSRSRGPGARPAFRREEPPELPGPALGPMLWSASGSAPRPVLGPVAWAPGCVFRPLASRSFALVPGTPSPAGR